VIEAQIRMRQQELQEDADRMKNKQTAVPTDTAATAHVEYHEMDDTSDTGLYIVMCRLSPTQKVFLCSCSY
jgi:hypothetical protein